MTKSARKFDQKRHVSNKAMQGILEAAAQYPLPIDEILVAVGIDVIELSDIDGRMTHNQACHIWQELVSRSGDPSIGLSLIKFAKPATYDVMGYIGNVSTNVGEALARGAQYSKILHTGASLTFETDTQTVRVTYTLVEPLQPMPMAYNEWVIATILHIYRLSTGVDLEPLKAGFKHPKPKNMDLYHSFFRCPIIFNQPTNEIIFNLDILKLPLLNADNKLSEIIEQYAKERLAKLPQSESFLDNFRQSIYQNLTEGDFSLNSISKSMGYTSRTLQRYLKESGLSYQKILDDIRQELAFFYLREGQISASEIGYLLGFSEPSAFYRSFRRWTGKSPSEFRRKYSD